MLIQNQRSFMIKECPTFKGPEINRNVKEENLNLILKSVQSIIDLNVNELNIHFLDHTRFRSDGDYQHFHEKIIKLTEQFYQEIASYPYSAQMYILDEDLRMSQRLFLPSTWTQIQKLGLETRIDAMKEIYYTEYKQFIPISTVTEEDGLDRFVYSPFGKMLFNNDTSHVASRNIKLYIDFLRIRNRLQEVMDYNNLVKTN